MPLRYKDYTFPHNPKIYSIEYRRDVVAHKLIGGSYTMQDMGLYHRVIRGEGEFVGKTAYADFSRLACIFYKGGPGVLIHPRWVVTSAYLTELSLAQDPRPEYVRYTFTFLECLPGGTAAFRKVETPKETAAPTVPLPPPAEARFYTVKKGECLWVIAHRYGTTVAALAKLNPNIENVNHIFVGQKVRIR
ncbi:MAG: LysM peptidoglycan-binding domain-containing protein [Oscillospiraceae bacterium]